ncbi:guanine permease [bacterium SCN 62-11]|nr:NCS2 family permease [Candidatus Eremiobacteraeota bacterium]ODT68839.1 MAG: guanine permease [bacterium SCN 62-11]
MLKRFELEKHGVSVGSEVLAGLTTFATMAYILFLNPVILGDAGMDRGAVLIATALAAGIGSILMGLIANLPFALAPGMGMNAYFTYTVVKQMGIPWQTALAAVFLDGVIFLILSLLPFRSRMIEDIPYNIKLSAAAAIGLFIAFIGFKNAGLIQGNPVTLVEMGSVYTPANGLMIFGLMLMAALLQRKVKGALLWGMLAVTALGFVVPGPEGHPLVSTAQMSWPSVADLSKGLFKLDFAGAEKLGFAMIVFTFTFVSLFDTAGTFVGLATKLGWISREKPIFKEAPRGLIAESFAIMIGALLGTSTTTTYIESASGIAQGGRTGLTAVTAGLCFCLGIVLAPLATLIPVQATSPVLILVGCFMLEPVLKLELDDLTEALPAFLTLLLVPLTFNIANGLIWGIVSFTMLKLATGRIREIKPTMWILTILCLISLSRAH